MNWKGKLIKKWRVRESNHNNWDGEKPISGKGKVIKKGVLGSKPVLFWDGEMRGGKRERNKEE